jgi:hypothetical protein
MYQVRATFADGIARGPGAPIDDDRSFGNVEDVLGMEIAVTQRISGWKGFGAPNQWAGLCVTGAL